MSTSALEIALCLTSDLIIMDLVFPEMDGLEVCRQLRTARNTTTIPMMMVAESVDEIDIVASLEVGADCFLTKPFAYRESLARIRVLLRRAGSSCTADYHPEQDTAHLSPSSRGELVVGPLRIDQDGWCVTCRGKGLKCGAENLNCCSISFTILRRPRQAVRTKLESALVSHLTAARDCRYE